MLLPLPTKQFKTGRVVTDWSAIGKGSKFQVNSTQEIEVVSNKQVEKTSKTGNKRKERRLEIKLRGFKEIIEVGTESFKKLSFMKRLSKMAKTSDKNEIKYELVSFDTLRVTNLFNVLDEDLYYLMEGEMIKAENLKEIKNVYKKWAKKLHPDKEKNNFALNSFELLKSTYDYYKALHIKLIDNLREAGLDVEY